MKINEIIIFIEIFMLIMSISFAINLFITKYSTKLGIFLDKDNINKPQKMHFGNIPRAGGISIFISFIIAILLKGGESAFGGGNSNPIAFGYILLIIPIVFVFLSGILEDFNNSLTPKMRLLLQILGAISSVIIFNSVITNIGFSLPFYLGAVFSIFCIVGVINAINIIDGFNGLASGISIMILISIAIVSYKLGDFSVFYLSITLCSAVCGFMLLNFPFGKIFLGDGGAYLLGFMLAFLLIMLTQRNYEISAWYGLCIMIYPIFEVLFSIYRKKIVRGTSIMQPDAVHFHMLIYKRLIKSNYKTSIFIWILNIPFIFLPIFFFNNIIVLVALILTFILIYIYAYNKIIRFRNLKI